jgi:hypothetical protein
MFIKQMPRDPIREARKNTLLRYSSLDVVHRQAMVKIGPVRR